MIPRGFPGALPAGETLLWQGAPHWRVLARNALRVRGLALYFAGLAVLAGLSGGGALAAAKVAGLGLVPLALAFLYAYAVSRTTVYSITDRRVVLHIGLALPVTLNLPLARVVSADLRTGRDGGGDLSLTLSGRDRFAYLVLWPHARPWRFSPAQPTMRGLADAAHPAQVLAGALSASVPAPAAERPAVRAGSGFGAIETPLAA